MRRRITSLLLAFLLCLTLLPTAALADGTDDTGGALSGMPLTQELIESKKGYTKDEGIQLLAGDYYLTGNVYLVGDDTGAWSLSLFDGAVTLDLNGYVLDLRGANICAFRNLTLKDSNTGNQSHKFRVEESGLWVWDETAGTETVTGGVITGGKGAEDSNGIGGGVYINSGKTFTMNGGSIVGCTAAAGNATGTFSGIGGGGVYIGGSSGSFTMTGGRIVGCTAGGAGGGGVYIGAGSSFRMEGGSIESCTAGGSGGGVYSAGSFTMAGGRIEDCTAANGGGVYSEADFTMEDGSIVSCTANGDGGGVLSDADFTMEGGIIEDCTAANGGGVSIADSKTFTMNSGSIVGCTAAQAGGGVIVKKGTNNEGTFTMNGGSISGCTACGDTPNAVHADGTLTFENGTSINKSLLTGIKAGHTGGKDDPILIGSAEGLKDFRDKVNGGKKALCAKLVCDIVLNDGTFDEDGTYTNAAGQISMPAQWAPIGSSASNPYKGTFNGSGKTIKGLYVNVINQSQSNEYIYHAGLFGYTDGAAINGVTVDGYVSISGDFSNGNDSTNVGGIVGYAKDTTITGCTNLCTVKSACTSVRAGSFAGGIAGNVNKANEGSYSVTKCRNSGKVILMASYDGLNVGGIAGSSNALVSNCYNTGNIEVTSDYNTPHDWLCVGGVVGQNGAGAQVKSCYNTGAVTVTGDYTVAPDASAVGFGGVVGVSGGTVSKCYNTGKVTCDKDNANVGGVAGVNHDASITDCYFLKDTATDGMGKIIGNGTTNFDGKTKAEFADGTVLELLQNSEQNSPWIMTGYLEAAKMTLPLLSGQSADDHTHSAETGNCMSGIFCECGYEITAAQSEHDWGDWAQDSGKDSHTRKCQTEGCAGSETKACADTDNDGRCDVCGRVLRRTSRPSLPSYTVTVEKSTNGSVSADRKTASPGAAVTVTVTPDKGYTLETLTVTDKDGNELTLTDKGGGRYAFTMPSGSVTVTATFMDDNTMLNFFADVKASDYYYDAVLWAAQKGITSGTDAVHFSPNQPCTRGQIVTFLWRAAGSPVVNYAMNMSDVPENAYYAEAVRWALSEGITTGTTATTFGPNETCTRAQAVAFLFRYAAPAAVTLQELVSGFSDAASVPGYALPAMNWALAGGIVQGDGSKLLPNDSCTRGQIVTFLYRALEK